MSYAWRVNLSVAVVAMTEPPVNNTENDTDVSGEDNDDDFGFDFLNSEVSLGIFWESKLSETSWF